MTVVTPTSSARTPPRPIDSVIAPNTSENRKPTTRPMRLPGVRSWNSVWLGMTKTMFAMPIPNAIARTNPRFPDNAITVVSSPSTV